MEREKVVAILSAHDGLRSMRVEDGKSVDERGEFAAYLNSVFAAAEGALSEAEAKQTFGYFLALYDRLAVRVAALEAKQPKQVA